MKTETKSPGGAAVAEFKALMALLERFNLPPAMFHGLRCDAYEQQIAGQSVAALETVYCLLLQPGWEMERARAQCPRWPKGGRNAGKLPCARQLRRIKKRLVAASRQDSATTDELRERKRLAAQEQAEERRREELKMSQQKQIQAAAPPPPPPPVKNVFRGLKKTNAFLEKVYGLKFD